MVCAESAYYCKKPISTHTWHTCINMPSMSLWPTWLCVHSRFGKSWRSGSAGLRTALSVFDKRKRRLLGSSCLSSKHFHYSSSAHIDIMSFAAQQKDGFSPNIFPKNWEINIPKHMKYSCKYPVMARKKKWNPISKHLTLVVTTYLNSQNGRLTHQSLAFNYIMRKSNWVHHFKLLPYHHTTLTEEERRVCEDYLKGDGKNSSLTENTTNNHTHLMRGITILFHQSSYK